MLALLDGPLSVENLTAFLNEMEPILTPYLAADPNNQIGEDIAGHFDSLRNWVSNRHANVYDQVIADMGPGTIPGDFNGDGAVDAADYVVWRKGLGPIYPQLAYNVWRARFGEIFGNGTGG